MSATAGAKKTETKRKEKFEQKENIKARKIVSHSTSKCQAAVNVECCKYKNSPMDKEKVC